MCPRGPPKTPFNRFTQQPSPRMQNGTKADSALTAHRLPGNRTRSAVSTLLLRSIPHTPEPLPCSGGR